MATWLAGNGAVAIFNLMEDAATAEIARCQIWQWIHNGVVLDTGRAVTADLVRDILHEEVDRAAKELGDDAAARLPDAAAVFEEVALADELADFLTIPALRLID